MTETSKLRGLRVFSVIKANFKKIALKDDSFLNFITSQEKRIDKIDYENMSEETQRHLKSVETRRGLMYASCKVNKKCINGCPPFISIASALETPT